MHNIETEDVEFGSREINSGDVFQNRSRGSYHMVAQIKPNEYVLLGLQDGNRWAAPTDRFEELFGPQGPESFRYVQEAKLTIEITSSK